MRRLAISLLPLLAACAVHEAYGFRAAEITIGDRGISIPVPPPSLTDDPVQESTVAGSADFELDGPAGEGEVMLHLLDQVSRVTASVTVDPQADTFELEGVQIDHSDNCLELWLEAPDGARSPVVRYHTVIEADDRSVRVEPGCDP